MDMPEISAWIEMDDANCSPGAVSAQTYSAPNYDPDLLYRVESQKISPTGDSRLISLTDQDSAAAEAFRLVAVRLREMRLRKPLKKLLITSTIPQEGKSMVAANLACTLAQRQQENVLLLEGDVRRPSLLKTFGMEERIGLCEWLRKKSGLVQCITFLPDVHLWLLPAGNANGNPMDILQPQELSPLIALLTEMFSWIIIDSPPELPLADVSVWSALSDGILLVTRYGTTKKKELLRGVKTIDSQKVIGAILNGSKSLTHSGYYYYGYSPREK
jgi:capsular exopolysaccharide synthesis family protein